MTFTLHNANCTAEGVSADNVLANLRAMGSNLALVRDSGKLVAMCADPAVNIRTVFRAAGDDPAGNPLAQNPAAFVNARVNAAPQATWIHLSNEVGFSDALDTWTRAAVTQVIARGKTAVAVNAATNQSLDQWKAHEALWLWLRDNNQRIGVHFYPDGTHDAGGLAPIQYLASLNCKLMITEFAPIQSIFDANTGYLGMGWDAVRFNTFMDDWSALLAPFNAPLFDFSEALWPNNPTGAKKGFGWGANVAIVQHYAVLNASYPVKEQPVTTPTTPIVTIPASPGVAVPATVVASGVRLRASADLAAPILRNLALDEAVTLYSAERPTVSGYPFAFLHDKNGAPGWAAIAALDGTAWIRVNAPTAETNVVTVSNVPYASEFGWATGWTALCGESSLFMLLEWDRLQKKVALPPEITPLSIARYLGKGAKDFSSLQDLQKAGSGYGLVLDQVTGKTGSEAAAFEGEIGRSRPIVALLDYSKLPTRADKGFSGNHILVVVGYSDQSVICNDPDNANGVYGPDTHYPRADFLAAWVALGSTALVLG